MQRPARHQRHHRLPGTAGGEEGRRTPDRPAERRRALPHRLRPQRPAVNLRSAFAASAGGSGRTIAVVDAYDDPNAEPDLANTTTVRL
ncbi:hypothetical protein AB5J72_39335 [Streptomyces sp. CG1]|uniref:hypothetical protein n=1 Tax=Streptomyces sp. CG1 TaxID=1287523 RepID=UPI0034E260A3